MAEKGEWDFQLSPVFTIGILNFTFKDHESEKDTIRHHVQLKDQNCKVFYDKLHFIYLELPKFTKTLQTCTSRYEKWLWIFKNLPSLEDIPVDLKEDIFIKLFNISEVAKFGVAEQAAYQQSLKYLRDLKNVVDTAHREGREEGREEGELVGLEKGKQEKAIETACKLKKIGTLTNQEIANIVGLPLLAVEDLDC